MASEPPNPAASALGNPPSIVPSRTASHSQHIKPVNLTLCLPSCVLLYTAIFHTPQTAPSPFPSLLSAGRSVTIAHADADANATPQPVSNEPLLPRASRRSPFPRPLVPSVSLDLDALRFAIPFFPFRGATTMNLPYYPHSWLSRAISATSHLQRRTVKFVNQQTCRFDAQPLPAETTASLPYHPTLSKSGKSAAQLGNGDRMLIEHTSFKVAEIILRPAMAGN